MFLNYLPGGSKRGILAGILMTFAFCLTLFFIPTIRALSTDNLVYVRVEIVSVDLDKCELRSNNKTAYSIDYFSQMGMTVSEEDMQALVGKEAELGLDADECVMSIKAEGKEYINAEKAIKWKRGFLSFMIGICIAFGPVGLTISLMLYYRKHRIGHLDGAPFEK